MQKSAMLSQSVDWRYDTTCGSNKKKRTFDVSTKNKKNVLSARVIHRPAVTKQTTTANEGRRTTNWSANTHSGHNTGPWRCLPGRCCFCCRGRELDVTKVDGLNTRNGWNERKKRKRNKMVGGRQKSCCTGCLEGNAEGLCPACC